MSKSKVAVALEAMQPGGLLGRSDWLTVDQAMIDRFGAATLDPDPMHVDPEWAKANGPFGGTIAFGFLTISLLTHLLHGAMGTDPIRDAHHQGYYLNYGFDRLRLVAPVKAGSRVRGVFTLAKRVRDERNRLVSTFDCVIEIEGEERPALIAQWLSVWVPPEE